MKKVVLLFISLFLIFKGLVFSQYPAYVWPDTSQMGQYMSRTMDLLQNSDPSNKTTVRILVYGQSINAQDWWQDTKTYLETLYPNANIDMRNLSIGGYQSDKLWKTSYFDVLPFYPDLVLFHDYGGFALKKRIAQIIRENTSAEILWRSSHFHQADASLDDEHDTYIPQACNEYHLQFGSFRDEWVNYLDVNNLAPADLLSDNIHLNAQGKFLMSEMHKPYLQYRGKWESDPDSLMTEFSIGSDISWNADTLMVDFCGNRCDLVFDDALAGSSNDTMYFFLDGVKIKDIKDICRHTRPYKDNLCLRFAWGLPSDFKMTYPWLKKNGHSPIPA